MNILRDKIISTAWDIYEKELSDPNISEHIRKSKLRDIENLMFLLNPEPLVPGSYWSFEEDKIRIPGIDDEDIWNTFVNADIQDKKFITFMNDLETKI